MGLRSRVIAAFTLGGFLLSVVLALSTYVMVRQTLVKQREDLAMRQTYVNARLVRSGLHSPRTDLPKLLSTLENPTGSRSLLAYQGKWYSSDLHIGQNVVPASLRESVAKGIPARMRFRSGGDTQLVVGIPIPSVGANYFEVSGLEGIEGTLSAVAWTLLVGSSFTTLGAAALGWWSSRLVLQPVTVAAAAAEAIAGGDLTARLQPEGDADLDRLVTSFNRMVDALQGRIERDARFASDVSHELRSPLMTLASGLAVLQSRRHELPPRSQTALDLLSDEVMRFQRMVQDLLEISRVDAGHSDVFFEEVRIGEFVARVAERYEREIPIDGDEAVLDAIVMVDKRRMERVLGNLIENADRYAGGVVRIEVQRAGKQVRVLVEDAGPGVPVEERERIFERFARGASARDRKNGEGTGLGLSLVAEHLHLHGGRVWVEDRPGGGARFVVELPEAEE